MTAAIASPISVTTTKVEAFGRTDDRVLTAAPTPPASSLWNQSPHDLYVRDATPVAIQVGGRTVYVPARVELPPKAVIKMTERPTYVHPNQRSVT